MVRWAKQEKKAQVVGKVDYHKKAMEKKEEVAGAKAFGHHTYRKMDLQNKLQQSESETNKERAVADQAAKKELSHLNKLNSEVRGQMASSVECAMCLLLRTIFAHRTPSCIRRF